jgi:hypothetical protein
MTINSIKLLPFLVVIIMTGCTKRDIELPLIYQYKISEFNRDSLSPKNFMETKHRFKYIVLNDSLILIANLVDSVRPYDSSKFELERHAEMNDSLFLNTGESIFVGSNINENTKLLIQYSGGYIDTFKYYCFKEYNGMKIYSLFCSSCRNMDSGYNIFLADSIGLITTYSGPWHMISVLDKIYNSDGLNNRLQNIKDQLLNDTLFYPNPIECFDNEDTVRYTSPMIIEE